MNARDLLPAFADLVHDSQATFRVLLAALSAPGTVHEFPVAVMGPDPLCTAATAALLTLADMETPVWLDVINHVADEVANNIAARRVTHYLSFHCGCPITDVPAVAAFALITHPEQLSLVGFAQGSMAYPDRSTMLLVQVASLSDGPQRTLSGPGIRTRQALRIAGLPADFDEQWRVNGASFPTGVDLVFCCGNRIVALPRTTRIDTLNSTAENNPCTSP